MFRCAAVARAAMANGNWLKEFGEEIEEPNSGLLLLFVPNWAGSIKALPLFAPFLKESQMNYMRPMLTVAAEKWRRAHDGKTPPTLDALVPDYLAAAPKDPWSESGEPIKYDAASGVAWSVGKDGKYDYRKVAKERKPAAVDSSADGDTQKYAFRLDGKSVYNDEGK